MKDFKLLYFYYSPGYGDMTGAFHSVVFRKDRETGGTVVETSDREWHSDPLTVCGYEVNAEALAELEAFISKKKIMRLEKRPKSNLFATDYSPWRINFDYSFTRFGKVVKKDASLAQYRFYTRSDRANIDELIGKFKLLRGEKLYERIKER